MASELGMQFSSICVPESDNAVIVARGNDRVIGAERQAIKPASASQLTQPLHFGDVKNSDRPTVSAVSHTTTIARKSYSRFRSRGCLRKNLLTIRDAADLQSIRAENGD
jgi:hypothetical protein